MQPRGATAGATDDTTDDTTKLRALVVADDAARRTMVTAALRARGVETVALRHPSDAGALLAGESFALALVSTRGDVLSALRSTLAAAPRLLVALAEAEDDVDELIGQGFDDVLDAASELGAIAARLAVVERACRERISIARRDIEIERLASLGLVAAGVAHEINNPLSYVVTDLRSVEERLQALTDPSYDETRALVYEAREGVDRVVTLVRDLGAASKPGDGVSELVSVEEVLDSTANLVRHEVRKRATLLREYAQTAPIEANRARLGQVFLNLILNALQALQGAEPSRDRIVLRTRSLEQRTVVEVEDSGAGMDAATRARIFDAFFTTKAGSGTGLGLTITRTIVGELGGVIEVDSEPGRGTVFRLSFPARAADDRAAPIAPASLPPARARIFVVDDEAAVGRALVRVLGGHDVKLVTSGREALEHLREHGDYDAIFCDLSMPDLDGIALYQSLAATHAELLPRFVFVTGGAIGPDARSFLSGVTNAVLGKPYDLKQVRATLRAQLELRERLRKR